MIKAVIKRPKEAATTHEFKNINEIYKLFKSLGYITFKNDIGMYFNDGGYYSGYTPNFTINSHIVYGIVVFVGLDDEGKPKKLTYKQQEFVKEFLRNNSYCR